MKFYIQVLYLILPLIFFSCKEKKHKNKNHTNKIKILPLNSVVDKANFSAGYNQCMEFYKISSMKESKDFFNLVGLSNGYINGLINSNSSDSLKHSIRLKESFNEIKPDTSNYSIEDLSYSYGYIEAQKQLQFFKKINFEEKKEYIKNGYIIAAVKQKSPINQNEMNEILKNYISDVTSKTYSDFLKANSERENIHTTKSGLLYEVIKIGEGNTPRLGQKVTFHIIGKHYTGQEFLNSKLNNKNNPITTNLPYPGVPAINEALLLMKKGAKYKFYVPSILGYGIDGFMNPNKSYYIIKPNEPIVYEIELVDIID